MTLRNIIGTFAIYSFRQLESNLIDFLVVLFFCPHMARERDSSGWSITQEVRRRLSFCFVVMDALVTYQSI